MSQLRCCKYLIPCLVTAMFSLICRDGNIHFQFDDLDSIFQAANATMAEVVARARETTLSA